MATISEIITNGRLSVPLSSNYQSKKSMFGPAVSPIYLPELIAMVTDALEWMNDGGNYTDAEETAVANYLVWLSGRFGLQAASISGSGGRVTPIVPGGGVPDPYDFEVDAYSFIATGETTKVFPSEWAAYNILLVRNSITQSTVNQGATYYSWNRTTRTLSLFGPAPTNGAAQATELFQIYPIV